MGLSNSKQESYHLPDNDYELAISCSKELEHLLEVKFGATGKGLHERVSSVENRLPVDMVRDMRYIATIRNHLIHDVDFKTIPDKGQFIKRYTASRTGATQLAEHRSKGTKPKPQPGCVICWGLKGHIPWMGDTVHEPVILFFRCRLVQEISAVSSLNESPTGGTRRIQHCESIVQNVRPWYYNSCVWNLMCEWGIGVQRYNGLVLKVCISHPTTKTITIEWRCFIFSSEWWNAIFIVHVCSRRGSAEVT